MMSASTDNFPDCADMSALSDWPTCRPEKSGDMSPQSLDMSPQSLDMSPQSSGCWPHAPPHWTYEPGVYFITASTLHRHPIFKGAVMLDYLESTLLTCLEEGGWKLQAWAVFPNHYHFVASHARDARALSKVLGKVHMLTAKQANLRDGTPGRQIWFNFRDTQLTYEKSWLARLAYVMGNPVKHGLVLRPEQYPWCSAAWFSRNATRAFVRTVNSFKTDRVAVEDPFEVSLSDCSDMSERTDCSDMSELSDWPTCRPEKSGDMSPHSYPTP